MACFSLVASAWKSTRMASAPCFRPQASTSRSTARNGSPSSGMKISPMALMTSTSAPFLALNRPAPRPGVPAG